MPAASYFGDGPVSIIVVVWLEFGCLDDRFSLLKFALCTDWPFNGVISKLLVRVSVESFKPCRMSLNKYHVFVCEQ